MSSLRPVDVADHMVHSLPRVYQQAESGRGLMAAWYVATDTELLIDLDDPNRRTQRGGRWIEEFFRQRLRAAILAERLAVRSVYLVPSSSDKHVHAIVRLLTPMPALERLVWQLHLGSDLYRGRADLMRLARGIQAPSLLILPAPIPEFYRRPSRVCLCTEKHVTDMQFGLGEKGCPVWRELRGLSPWELFGPSSREPERGVRLPMGRVPMTDILAKVAISPVAQSDEKAVETRR